MRDPQFGAVAMTAAASTSFLETKEPQQGLLGHLKEAYKSPDKWAAESLDKLTDTAKEIATELKGEATHAMQLARKALSRKVTDTIAAEAGSDIGMTVYKTEMKLAQAAEKAAHQLSKFSVLAKRGLIALDVTDKTIAVATAPKGRKARTAFEKGMEFAGEGAGAFAGGIAADALGISTMGSGFILAPSIMIGTAATGGYAFEKLAETAEESYDNITSHRRN